MQRAYGQSGGDVDHAGELHVLLQGDAVGQALTDDTVAHYRDPWFAHDLTLLL